MKKIVLFFICAFCLTFYLYTSREKSSAGTLRGLDPENIDMLEIKGKNPILLSRTGSEWKFSDGLRADRRKIEAFISFFYRSSPGIALTADVSRESEFNIGPDSPVMVFRAGDKKISFILGLPEDRRNSFYLKYEGEAGIYELPGSLALPDTIDMAEMKIFTRQNPEKITISTKGKKLDFISNGGLWENRELEDFNKDISKAINSFLFSRAKALYKNEKKNSPIFKLELFYSDGEKLEYEGNFRTNGCAISCAEYPSYTFICEDKDFSPLISLFNRK
ncbi:MAG: hypothetical protein Fur0012_13550 [Elusimicrobiota bacterium]